MDVGIGILVKGTSKMKRQLVIFDLDGTLLNTIDDLGNACNVALAEVGLPPHPIAKYPSLVGNGIVNLMRKAVAEHGVSEVETVVEKMIEPFKAYYGQHSTDFTRPYEGIVDVLDSLQKQDVLLAVASNKYQQATEAIVAHFFPNIHWIAVLGQREGVAKKPDPTIVHEIIALAQKELHLSEQKIAEAEPDSSALEVLYVGDSDVDMQTAKNANVESIGVTWGFRKEDELVANGACMIVHKPYQIEREVRVKRAIDYFMNGYNCCQAVVCALRDRYDIDETTALRFSASFGGGIGRMRLTCGAASAMFMLAGYEEGQTRPNDNEQKMVCYKLVQTLAEEFKSKHGSMTCQELLEMRAGGKLPADKYAPRPDDRTAAYYAQRPCLRMIASAVRIYCDQMAQK